MATINDVCKLAGVSKATVSRVLNNTGQVKKSTADAVYQAINTLGYKPNSLARALATNCTNTLGLVVSAFEGAYFSSLMRKASETSANDGKQLLIMDGGHSPQSEEKAIHSLVERKVDAVILYTRKMPAEKLKTLMESLPVPLIVINQMVEGFEPRCICFDQYQAACNATEFLIAKGHNKIACISGPENSVNSSLRLQGFKDTLAKHHLPLCGIYHGNYYTQSGYHACQALLDSNQPFSALFAANDSMAMGAIRALHEAGINVPEEISVMGFDNDPAGPFLIPSLSSIMLPVDAMAQTAIEQAMRLLKGDKISEVDLFSGSLIVRESVDQLKKPR
ncbi:LacI family DNA-binding transcriptional regulator [Photobacterium chitinilyticum]|uniref:LacI family DNA-binding transcriptional regulator n=1 Tax=Photobacterium chitinilyticum TaxID=2485123 RepID=A0A444JKR1_9GAMM|nr:LacI family DNA-binding transcriptional regulator [Photobacterium chitinilyticum]RWX53674.1 LacI family DNA-binding transcriptional regulator [Photobacterium chitinilyticum]